MNSTGAGLIASTLPLIVVLTGCASSATADPGQVVVGSGSDQERQEIEASDRRMMQAEQSGVSSQTAPIIPAAPVDTPPAPPPATPPAEPAPASAATPPDTQ